MNQNDLFECFAKLNRAKLHAKNLKAQLNPNGSRGYGMNFNVDYERQEIVVSVHPQRRALITHWAILTGEIIHQLRSSLDHAIRHLVIANGNTPKERDTAFPVFSEEEKYDSRDAQKKIVGVSDEAAKIIRSLQPFGPNFAAHPLYVLNELWNRDKHRLLNFGTVRMFAVQLVAMYPDRQRTQIVELPDATDRDGDELIRQPLNHRLERAVQIYFEILSAHKFVDAGPATGRAFPEYLDELIEFTESALRKLAATTNRAKATEPVEIVK